MFGKAHGILATSSSAAKGLAGAHPVFLGAAVGISAYYAVSKYWLNKDEVDETTESEEELEEAATT